MDGHFFDGIFDNGAFTEERIEKAGVRIMELVQQNKAEDAETAQRILAHMFIMALANRLVVNPEECASQYGRVINAAFGKPTLLDEVKHRLTNRT